MIATPPPPRTPEPRSPRLLVCLRRSHPASPPREARTRSHPRRLSPKPEPLHRSLHMESLLTLAMTLLHREKIAEHLLMARGLELPHLTLLEAAPPKKMTPSHQDLPKSSLSLKTGEDLTERLLSYMKKTPPSLTIKTRIKIRTSPIPPLPSCSALTEEPRPSGPPRTARIKTLSLTWLSSLS
jgi:hypothetical protein